MINWKTRLMKGKNNGPILNSCQFFKYFNDPFCFIRVKTRSRLIQNEKRWLWDHFNSNTNSFFLTSRYSFIVLTANICILTFLQLKNLNHLFNSSLRLFIILEFKSCNKVKCFCNISLFTFYSECIVQNIILKYIYSKIVELLSHEFYLIYLNLNWSYCTYPDILSWGACFPANNDMSVVFPAPEDPIIASIYPGLQ